ncbi:nuclear protein export factor [Encephalitozoon intestinalis ATCC 50506]|uniref:Nuclear protein export factor n=1 Tax=Encephalitozoon intestinalis (strain ATCC 50506) TaxID=876142 RepID=E0S6S8_ENCIT|nr:nuclear protein export factor [Encephalitozoon intestinalis ATCC 50506]ADM11413.1 nuclear protein export factor [Encephalitozoon intestinalis ATCC 50506]UTX45105.1 SAC3/GANP family-like protein [Encephalitozoon intestinalis]
MEDLRVRYKRLQEKRRNTKKGKVVIGECITFCPEFEGLERVLNNEVSPYETEVMVKKYRKSFPDSGGVLAEDIRPIEVLWRVINHVIRLCADDQSIQIYKFVENRIRAVLLDMKVQEERGREAIEILEKVVRFYIVFRYQLYDHPQFNKDLNLSQLRMAMETLMRLYSLESRGYENRNKEEFYCYHILASMCEKYVLDSGEQDDGPRIRLSMEITKKYMQGNGAGFFRLLRKLDYISFCLAQSFIGEVRGKCVQLFKKSLVEKVKIGFFGDVLLTSEAEAEDLFRDKGIPIRGGKVDFEEKGCGEEYDKVVPKSRKIETNVKKPVVFMLHGAVDYQILSYILSAVLWKKLNISKESLCNKFPKDKERLGSVERKTVVRKICVSILEEIIRKTTIEVFSRIMFLNALREYLVKWRNQAIARNKDVLAKNKYILLVVLDREVSSVSLVGNINSSILNILAPTITYIEKITVDEMLMYNLCIFSTSRNRRERLYNKYRMVNLIVDTPQGLSKRVDEIYERAVNSPKIRKSTLLTLIGEMSKVEAIETIVKLIDNGRNEDSLENNLSLLYDDKPLTECDVYYEEGSMGHTGLCL